MKTDNFETSLKRLEEIAEKLESSTYNLEESLALFEEGTKLYDRCTDILNSAEKKLLILTKNKDVFELTEEDDS